MTNTTTTTTDAPELAANVTSTGSPSATPTYAIAPDDRHIADHVLAMHPIDDVPSPYEFPEGWKVQAPGMAALPPEMREAVSAKLAQLGPVSPEQLKAKEAEFTAEAIRSKRGELRAMIGVGQNALPYHREMAGIAREYRDLAQQFDRITEELADVARHDTQTDPATGKPVAVPVMRVQGTRRAAYLEQQDSLLRQMRLLANDDGTPGHEGAQRMKQALSESVALLKDRQQQAEEAAEAKRRAEHIVREDRINRRAESLARMHGNASR